MRQAILTVGGLTFLSRVTGFVRDTLIAHFLGTGPLADAFFVAFKFPNFFRRFFAEGALSAAFIPIFSDLLAKKHTAEAKIYAEQVFTLMLLFLMGFVLIFEIFMPQILALTAPGFPATPQRFQWALEMTRLSFPYILFVSLAALLSGILNTFQKFAAAAATPILLNLFMISALFAFALFMPTLGHALAFGVLIAGVIQLLWLYLGLAQKFPLRLRWPQWNASMRQFCRLLLPGAMGAGVFQINLFIDMFFASLLPSGAVSYLFYADRLNQLPLGVIGIAISTALLPELSRQVGLKAHDQVHRLQTKSLEFALILTVPAALGLIWLAYPLVEAIFQRGAFHPEAVQETARVLIAFASGLPAYVMIKIFSTSFFARQDTQTPILVGSLAVGVNLVLNILLHQPLAHVGIALSTALAAWINAFCLGGVLWYRETFRLEASFWLMVKRLSFCCLFMSFFLIMALYTAQVFSLEGTVNRLLTVAFFVGGGLLCFMGSAHLTGLMKLNKWEILSPKS